MNGNGNKIALVAIAVVAIGIFALPSTISLFGGQHTWYELGGAEVPCKKCHADIYEELSETTAHATLDCYACHRANLTIQYAAGGGSTVKIGKQAHAASTVACMACHEYNAKVRGNEQGPFAGGFRLSGSSPGSSPGLSPFSFSSGSPSPFSYTGGGSTGVQEVHNAYILAAIGNDLMEDSNEACIACHTDIAMEIDWTHASTMYSKAKADELGKWTMEQFEARGYYYTTTFGTADDSEVIEGPDSDIP